MNVPGLIDASEINIISEYKKYPDVKHVAKVFDISTKEVRDILKQAGIKISKENENVDSLKDIGISEKDLYKEKDEE